MSEEYGGHIDQKYVLDSNIDKANILDFESFAKLVISTLDKIIESIKPLCGKYALSNMVIYDKAINELNTNVYSNDGIHILKSIEYLSPIQKYIVNLVKYIADKVNSAAADGTSTAIFITASYIKIIFEEILESIDNDSSPNKVYNKMLDRHKLISKLIDELNEIRSFINKITIDPKNVNETLRMVLIRSLAMTSSKNNKTLADFAVEIFKDIPETLYEFSYYKRSKVETEEEFIIERSDYDALLTITTSQKTVFNAELYTAINYENCKLIVLPYFINDINVLIDFLKKHKEENILIVYKDMNDSDVVKLEQVIDPNYVTICRHTVSSPVFANNPIELLTLLAKASKEDYKELTEEVLESNTIEGVNCYIKGNILKIRNMVQWKEDTFLHPNYLSKEHNFFNKLEKEIREEIDKLKNDVRVSHDNTFVIKELTRVYRDMICGAIPILTIGGSTTKHLANVNVVEDVIGAVSVAMKHGFVLDGILKLFFNFINKDKHKYICKIIHDFAFLTYGENTMKNIFYVLDKTKNDILKENSEFTYFNQSSKDFYNAIEMTEFDNINTFDVVQSAKAFDELFKRMIEVLPELIKVNSVIVPNSVVMGNGND